MIKVIGKIIRRKPNVKLLYSKSTIDPQERQFLIIGFAERKKLIKTKKEELTLKIQHSTDFLYYF